MKINRRNLGYRVQPRTSKELEVIGKYTIQLARKLNCVENGIFVNIVKLYEHINAKDESDIGFFSLFEDDEPSIDKDVEAYAVPNKEHIRIRRRVYDAACDGCPDARFTLAHELSHVALHNDLDIVALTRSTELNHRKEADSEWQADELARFSLVDYESCAGMSAATIAKLTGIPFKEALIIKGDMNKKQKTAKKRLF